MKEQKTDHSIIRDEEYKNLSNLKLDGDILDIGGSQKSGYHSLLGQNAPYDDHHTLWNFEYAKSLLEELDFTDVLFWDYQNVDHNYQGALLNRIVIYRRFMLFYLYIRLLVEL